MGDVEDMIPLVIEALRELGGSARLIDISKYIWQHYQNELEIAGDLFYRWQYILRWVGTQLRNDGIMLPAAESPSGLWVLAPQVMIQMSQIPLSVINDLSIGQEYTFSDWPNEDLPDVAIGMYTIWKGDMFAYVGISGTAIKEEDYEKNIIKGLKQRLNAHRSGGIGGDKFCVYVFERFVSKELTLDDLQKMSEKQLTLGKLNKEFIQTNLTYRFTILDSAKKALEYEKIIKKDGIGSIGKPYLNG